MSDLGDWVKRSGKYQAFIAAIRGNRKALEIGTGCPISETFLYPSGAIHLIGRCLIGEVLRYIPLPLICQFSLFSQCDNTNELI